MQLKIQMKYFDLNAWHAEMASQASSLLQGSLVKIKKKRHSP